MSEVTEKKRARSPAPAADDDIPKRVKDDHEPSSERRGRFAEKERAEGNEGSSSRAANNDFRGRRSDDRQRGGDHPYYYDRERRSSGGGRWGNDGRRGGYGNYNRDRYSGGDDGGGRGDTRRWSSETNADRDRASNSGDLRDVIRGNRGEPFGRQSGGSAVDPLDRWGSPHPRLGNAVGNDDRRSFRGRGGRTGDARSRSEPEPRDTTYDYVIPRSDRYFEHDDRGELPMRNKGRRGGFRRFNDFDRPWAHDKFESAETSAEDHQNGANDEGNPISGGNSEASKHDDKGNTRDSSSDVKSVQDELNDREEFEETGGDQDFL